MGRRILLIGYAGIAYLASLAVFAYTIGFLADTVVPKGIDSGPAGSTGPAVLIDTGLLGLFGCSTA
jgi:methanethiol S-methyltransferase